MKKCDSVSKMEKFKSKIKTVSDLTEGMCDLTESLFENEGVKIRKLKVL